MADWSCYLSLVVCPTQTLQNLSNNNISKFDTWIGSPQKDALSPVPFTIYLEACMKSIRKTYPEKCYELTYADDKDCITTIKDLDLDSVGKLLQD